MTIFYFTATGNSLYIAKRLGGKLISISQALKSEMTTYADDAVGIVYPCHVAGVPRIVKRFIDKIKIKSNYTFAVMTYGNEATDALEQMNKYCKAQGIAFDYMSQVLMVDNYLPMFKVEEELALIPIKGIDKAISGIICDIQERKHYILSVGFGNKFWGSVFRSGAMKITGDNADKRFSVDNACTLCGTCEKLCPINNITISDRVIFNHHCNGCLACIHHCLTGAIHIEKEKSEVRFRNKNIEIAEIIAANE